MADDGGIVSNLGAARFARAEKPEQIPARTALDAALQYFDQLPADAKPDHIIVLVGKNVGDGGCSGTKFFQAGSYRHHGQMGLCLEGMHMIRESGQ